MDTSTRWLGLELENPLVLGASPVVDDLDAVRRAVDAGAAAVVMHSLFEEQLTLDALAHARHTELHSDSFHEAQSWLPGATDFALGPDEYLEQIRRIKAAVRVPVIGSLNGTTPRGWLSYAKLIQQAGADALELNVYQLAADPDESAQDVEDRVVEMVGSVASNIDIPLALKLSPFYTSLPHFAGRVARAGAKGLVLFNRFYQPDIDVEELEVRHRLRLSSPSELLLRLRWLAILFGRVPAELAVTGGVHSGIDAVKAIMTGASAVQMVSAVLEKGPGWFGTVLAELVRFLEEHEYESLRQMLGSMSLSRCPDPRAYERANYVHLLQTWHYGRDIPEA
jgi:dihydroorotate dehydrogenase (fumarate)